MVLTNLGVIKVTRSNAIDLSSKNRKGIEMNMIRIKKVYQDDSGASAMEYAILMGLIATVIISAVAIFGSSVQGLYAKGNTIF